MRFRPPGGATSEKKAPEAPPRGRQSKPAGSEMSNKSRTMEEHENRAAGIGNKDEATDGNGSSDDDSLGLPAGAVPLTVPTMGRLNTRIPGEAK